MLKDLRELLSDGTTLSTMRVLGFLIVGAILLVFISQNIQSLDYCKGFVDLAPNCRDIIIAIIVGKIAQNFTEKQGP